MIDQFSTRHTTANTCVCVYSSTEFGPGLKLLDCVKQCLPFRVFKEDQLILWDVCKTGKGEVVVVVVVEERTGGGWRWLQNSFLGPLTLASICHFLRTSI